MTRIEDRNVIFADRPPHTFHIPVMGTGFSIDTPLRVAQYGISSVISLVDDTLIEQMRAYHCRRTGRDYQEIRRSEEDSRARRITAYLDLMDTIVKEQVDRLQASPFEPGSPISRYYEMLPEIPLKGDYRAMLATECPVTRENLQAQLRQKAVPGSIDVNIMTKLDSPRYENGKLLPRQCSEALAALRGYARSKVSSALVLSAGMNQHLYSYIAEFPQFLPGESGSIQKRTVLKVSDYRSAVIQGKFLAKRGLWVSEFRIESGLNCGGHAFPTKGYLMGPILEEFKKNKAELTQMLYAVFCAWRKDRGLPLPAEPLAIALTVQGGIGTCSENEFLLKYYNVDGTGWGTPFLLVPEVANVDDEHLGKLAAATNDDVFLSDSSPLNVPFWNLRHSASENAREKRLAKGNPGTSCPKGHLCLNTEFTDKPICRASRVYQSKKLAAIAQDQALTAEQKTAVQRDAEAKSCICHDLGGSVKIKCGIEPEATPAICCGPNARHFKTIATLDDMVGHIYGRLNLLTHSERPHMFIEELRVYVEHLRHECKRMALGLARQKEKYYHEFKENLIEGIEYYSRLAGRTVLDRRDRFLRDLQSLRDELEILPIPLVEA